MPSHRAPRGRHRASDAPATGRHRAAPRPHLTRHLATASITVAGVGAAVLAATTITPHTSRAAEATTGGQPLTAALSQSLRQSGQQIALSSTATGSAQGADSRVHGVDGDGLPALPNRASRGTPRVTTRKPSFVRPGTGHLTTCFCMRWGVMHEGIDLAAPMGSPIYAAGAGVVTRTGPSEGFGFLIIVRLPDGTENWYGHEESTLVHVGQHVVAGQQIARVGSEGESTGPHLHFQVMVHGSPVDPIPWLKARGVTI